MLLHLGLLRFARDFEAAVVADAAGCHRWALVSVWRRLRAALLAANAPCPDEVHAVLTAQPYDPLAARRAVSAICAALAEKEPSPEGELGALLRSEDTAGVMLRCFAQKHEQVVWLRDTAAQPVVDINLFIFILPAARAHARAVEAMRRIAPTIHPFRVARPFEVGLPPAVSQ